MDDPDAGGASAFPSRRWCRLWRCTRDWQARRDRPSALADLMGTIVNDGRRRPLVDIQRAKFAQGTPYQTVFERYGGPEEQVMRVPVARLLRNVLAEGRSL